MGEVGMPTEATAITHLSIEIREMWLEGRGIPMVASLGVVATLLARSQRGTGQGGRMRALKVRSRVIRRQGGALGKQHLSCLCWTQ